MSGDVSSVFLEDIDADGALDLIITHNQPDQIGGNIRRNLSIIVQKNHTFVESDQKTIPLNSDEIVFDFGDIDNDRIVEFLFLKREGLYLVDDILKDTHETPRRVLDTDGFLPAHDRSTVKRYPLLRDLNKDNHPEILIPAYDSIEIYSFTRDAGCVLWKRLWVSSCIHFSPTKTLEYTYNQPVVHITDFNADTHPDILIISGEKLDVYLQYPSPMGEFSRRLIPPDFRYKFSIKNISPSVLEPLSPGVAQIYPYDLNRDGAVDILLSKSPRGGFTKNISQIQVYLNKNGRMDDYPDHILTSENVGGEHLVADINQDGLLDIVPLAFRIGLSQALRYLFTKKAGSAFEFYTMKEDASYSNKPDFKISFSREVKLDDILSGRFCMSLDGDFNGDRRHDLLIGTGINEITVIPGDEQKSFDKKASFTFNTQTSDCILIQDVNQDGVSDVVLWYPQSPTYSQNINLILSQ